MIEYLKFILPSFYLFYNSRQYENNIDSNTNIISARTAFSWINHFLIFTL